MNKKSLIVSVIALALSLFAICAVFSNPMKDVSSNLIATLGIICTVLIGWQILSFVNLNQYEERIRHLQSEIEITQKLLDEIHQDSYRRDHLSEGLTYHTFADIYRDISYLADGSNDKFLSKAVSWLLAEIEVCLYTNKISELRRAKNDIAEILSSNNLDANLLREVWDKCQHRYQQSPYPKNTEILEEIERVNVLFHSPC